MGKSIIIIGSGIGGLSAGCYAVKNNYNVDIFEMHSSPGGVCTSWNRKGYTFDYCIHHLAGTKPGTLLYSMWEELGAMPSEVIFPESLTSVEDFKENAFNAYYDLDKLKKEMSKIAPDDLEVIEKYIKASKNASKIDLLEIGLWKTKDWIKNLFHIMKLMKWGKVTMKQFGDKFSDPVMRRFFPTIQYDWEYIPMLLHLNIHAGVREKKYGWYKGGSLKFSQNIARRFRNLGGNINLNAKVSKILTRNNTAVGVKLEDGTEHHADYVISNAYEYNTVNNLLNGKYMTKEMKAKYQKPGEKMVMGLHVFFGVDRNLSNEPPSIKLFLEKPIEIAGEKRQKLDLEIYGFDSSMAPNGKGIIKAIFDTEYTYWKELYKNKAKYKEKKEEIAEKIIEVIEKRFPKINEQIEVVDVTTPVTAERFTASSRPYGDKVNFNTKEMLKTMFNKPSTLPGLRKFYMIGQSVGGAGIPGCAAMGKNVIKKICKADKIKYSY
ncbi:MAG: phytoene desaturase family protein [Petrotogales bacterium]